MATLSANRNSAEKIRIVLEGLRGESSIAELYRKESINQNLNYRWSKEFLDNKVAHPCGSSEPVMHLWFNQLSPCAKVHERPVQHSQSPMGEVSSRSASSKSGRRIDHRRFR